MATLLAGLAHGMNVTIPRATLRKEMFRSSTVCSIAGRYRVCMTHGSQATAAASVPVHHLYMTPRHRYLSQTDSVICICLLVVLSTSASIE